MAKTKLENLKLGIFVVLGTLLLLLAAYLIGNRQNMFGKTQDADINAANNISKKKGFKNKPKSKQGKIDSWLEKQEE